MFRRPLLRALRRLAIERGRSLHRLDQRTRAARGRRFAGPRRLLRWTRRMGRTGRPLVALLELRFTLRPLGLRLRECRAWLLCAGAGAANGWARVGARVCTFRGARAGWLFQLEGSGHWSIGPRQGTQALAERFRSPARTARAAPRGTGPGRGGWCCSACRLRQARSASVRSPVRTAHARARGGSASQPRHAPPEPAP